jgi:SAM-dependent methyltransferase
MTWTEKAKIQRLCAALPVFRDETYYLIQRCAGSLKRARDPRPLLQASVSMVKDLQKRGFRLAGKRAMEIGTGRYLELPLGMFLAGAGSVLTVDIKRLLKESLVLDSLHLMLANRREVIAYFNGVADPQAVADRLDSLAGVQSLPELLDRASIEYRAPADATALNVAAGTIDLQFSYTVFEHIPREVLVGILREAKRVLSPDGVAIHHIDPSDHFAHDDPSISMVNFLQFSDPEWDKISGNSFAFHNRLRAPDYRDIYEQAGHEVLLWDPFVQPQSLAALKNGLPLASEFQGRSVEELATVVLRVISKPIQVGKKRSENLLNQRPVFTPGEPFLAA